jgi:hypothetical protein
LVHQSLAAQISLHKDRYTNGEKQDVLEQGLYSIPFLAIPLPNHERTKSNTDTPNRGDECNA